MAAPEETYALTFAQSEVEVEGEGDSERPLLDLAEENDSDGYPQEN